MFVNSYCKHLFNFYTSSKIGAHLSTNFSTSFSPNTYSMHITPEENKLLAKLANFILENEIWKHSLLNECEYNIRLFTMKTHIPYRRTIYYLNNAFKKLIGERYFYEQTRLFGLIVISEPAKFRHKPKAKPKKPTNKPKPKRSDPRKPKSEFGRKYKEHFGQSASTTGKEYHNEYLYYRSHRSMQVGRRKLNATF